VDLDLKGKIAIVTGSGAGIGKAIALTLAGEGVDVAISDIDMEKAKKTCEEVKAKGCRSIAVKTDVANTKEVNDMVAQVTKELGKIDILVNNAGWTVDAPTFAQSSREKNWEPTINWCFMGMMNCTRAVIEQMIERKNGKIVSIISDAGRMGEAGMSTYSGAKGGIIAFSKALAREVGRYCINVNCVAPGGTLTEGIRARHEQLRQEMGDERFQERQRKQLNAYPIGRGLGRLALPEEIANMVVFLCSDRTAYVTGQTVSVSGGFSMM